MNTILKWTVKREDGPIFGMQWQVYAPDKRWFRRWEGSFDTMEEAFEYAYGQAEMAVERIRA